VIRLSRPLIDADDLSAVSDALVAGQLAQGAQVEAFEQEFAAVVAGRTCLAVSSGTTALHLGLLAAGIGPGDEVVVPSFTFAGSVNAVRLTGATPVFADIDPLTYGLCPDAVAAALSPSTAAVMVVHLYGQVADVAPLKELTDRHGLLLVEDACQAHGALAHGVPAGAWGGLAAFSFYATKNMTTGEGGMVVTEDAAVQRRLRLLRNQGMERRYENEIVGYNARLTDFAAALGRSQLRRLEERNTLRRHNAARYDEMLTAVTTPHVAPERVHVYHQYTVRTAERDSVQERLTRHGVESGVYYPVPVHRLPAYDVKADLPETERAAREVLSLPVGPHLTEQDLDAVVHAVNGA
jgi:perosamine synthetase